MKDPFSRFDNAKLSAYELKFIRNIHKHNLKLWLAEAAKVPQKTKHPKRLMLSALCHDMGKGVALYTDVNGISHYCNYKKDRFYTAKEFTGRITHSKNIAIYVENMIEMYKKPNEIIKKALSLK